MGEIDKLTKDEIESLANEYSRLFSLYSMVGETMVTHSKSKISKEVAFDNISNYVKKEF